MKVIIHAEDLILAAKAAKYALSKGKPEGSLPARFIEYELPDGTTLFYSIYWNKSSISVWEYKQ